MRVIIAGPRYTNRHDKIEFTDYDEVLKAVKASGFVITEVISGCAKGVDTLGLKFAEMNHIPLAKFPVTKQDWAENPKSAGFIRNENMACYASSDVERGGLIAVWDSKSNGTRDMIGRARAKGLAVFIWRVDKPNGTTQPSLF